MNFVLIPSYFSPAVNKLCEHLDVSDIKNLSLVSKEWFLATNTPLTKRTCITVKYVYYWKFKRRYQNIYVDIGDYEINKYLKHFLSWYNSENDDSKFLISELSLGTYKPVNSETFKMICQLKCLKSLTLRTNYLEPFDESLEISLKLREFGLYVSSFYRNHDDLTHAEKYIKNICQNNREITKFHCDYLTEGSLKMVTENCPRIQSLNYYNKLSLYPVALNSLYGTGPVRELAFFGIQDYKLFKLDGLDLRKLALILTTGHSEFEDLLKKFPKITHLSLTVLKLEEWVIQTISKRLQNLTSFNLICGQGTVFTEQQILPKLKSFKVNNLTTTHLLTKISTPSIVKIIANDIVSKEEFLNFLKDDYDHLKQLSIKELLHSSDYEICCVLKRLTSLRFLKISNCENFTQSCLETICDSGILNAEITMFSKISYWKFKLFNRKWSFKEKVIGSECHLSFFYILFGNFIFQRIEK